MSEQALVERAQESTEAQRDRQPLLARILRFTGWSLVVAGVVVLLYLLHALFLTGLTTQASQQQLQQDWQSRVGRVSGWQVDRAAPEQPPSTSTPPEEPRASSTPEERPSPQPMALPGLATGDPVAVLQFARPGGDRAPVHAEPLYVIEGVGVQQLQKGPGHYPGSALPGGEGNFAVAGHRTTYAAPFFHLNQLRAGDLVRVTDRRGTAWVYEIVEQRIVAPTDNWVLGKDPLGRGEPTLTLTTCHPRFSDDQRLIAFATLVSADAGSPP